jgi:hypothetical protein
VGKKEGEKKKGKKKRGKKRGERDYLADGTPQATLGWSG